MNKIFSWILGFTKIGKLVEKSQEFLSGKKAYLAGAAMVIPALTTIITNFADKGSSYLLGVAGTPEWDALMVGLGIMGLRAGVAKAVPSVPK